MKNLSELIPKEVDLIFTGKLKVLCSRQVLVAWISQREKELLKSLLDLEKQGHDLKSTIEWQLKGDIYKTEEELSNER